MRFLAALTDSRQGHSSNIPRDTPPKKKTKEKNLGDTSHRNSEGRSPLGTVVWSHMCTVKAANCQT